MKNTNLENEIRMMMEIKNADGMNQKKRILEENKGNEALVRLLKYALDPLLTYKISEQTLTKPMPLSIRPTDTGATIFEICDALSSKKALDDKTVYWVKNFLEMQPPEHKEFYIELLSKTLRLGITGKTVNKIIPGCVSEWEVQQAYPIEKYPIKPGTWFALTQKLNGVRATYYRGNLYARSGEVYTGLRHIVEKLSEFGDRFVFDGELILGDKGDLSDNEAFRVSTGIINSDAVSKTRISYTIFDVLPTEKFENEDKKLTYCERRKLLDELSKIFSTDGSCVSILPVLYEGTDQQKIPELLEQMVREDKEGLMANLDVPYMRKRHKGILKIKRFYTMDLPILRCEEGSGRLAGTLGSFVLDYNGAEVGVGTGFSDEQRQDFWANRDNMPGILCEVKYKEVSKDKKTGRESLQFPVFVSIRNDKTDVSFW